MAGINTAFNVGRGRSWGPEARKAPLSPRRSRGPAVLPGPRLSLSLSCHRPGPDASATTGRRIVIVSEIGDSEIAIDTDDSLFLFLFSFSPCLSPTPSSRCLKSPLSFVPPLALPPFKSSAKVKGSSFTLARGIMLTRSFTTRFLYLSRSL